MGFPLISVFMIVQIGAVCKWKNDGQHFLLEHLDTISNSPSHIYHSALPFCPSSSWLYKYYSAELSQMVKVVKDLPAEWGMCSRTVSLNSHAGTLSYHNDAVAVGLGSGDIIILNAITGIQAAVLSGHTSYVYSQDFSSDGTLLVSGSHDKTVKLWDVQTGGVIKILSGHTSLVLAVSISADCTTIASGSNDKSIRLWGIQNGECHHTIRQEDYVRNVSFSPMDPQYFISVCDKKIWQWDTNGHQIKPPFDGTCASFSTDGTLLVSHYKGVVTVQNFNSGVIVTKFHIADDSVQCCHFSPDDKLVAVAVVNVAYIWDITTSDPHLVETFIGHTNAITSLAFSSPSSLISESLDRSVKFWQIGTSSIRSAVGDPRSTPITSPSIWSASLQAGAGITISSDADGVVKTWDISTGLCNASFQTPAKNCDQRDVQLINGRLTIAWYAEEKVKVWDVEKGEFLLEVDGLEHEVLDLRISGDGSKILCFNAGPAQAWNIQTGKVLDGGVGQTRMGPFAIDGPRVWVRSLGGIMEWYFGAPDPSFDKYSTRPPDRPHPDGTKLWNRRLSRVEDAVTGKVVFQLPARFGYPIDVQWYDKYLVAFLKPKEILILEFHPTCPQ